MADQKITELTESTNSIYPDLVPVVDTQSNSTRRSTLQNLLRGLNYRLVLAPTDGNKKGADYICDGVADQTEIQNAINACSAAGGGTVYLRAGTYTTSGTILMKSNVRLIGEGFGTVVQGIGSTGFAIISSSGTSSGSPMRNIEIAHMKLDGSGVTYFSYGTAIKGIYITYIQKAFFHHLWVSNTYATGIGVDFLQDVIIENNLVEGCGRGITDPTTQEGGSGIGIGTGGFTDEPTVVANNICHNNGKHGIFFEGQSNTPGNYAVCSNNVVYANYDGLGARSNLRIIFNGNISYSNTRHGMELSDSPFSGLHNTDVRVTNNIFRSNGAYGLSISNTHTNTYVGGNQFDNNTTASFTFSASTSMVIKDNVGYNPVGISSISVTGSPFTYTAGNSRETVYIKGGTVSDISKGGNTLYSDTGHSIELQPNEAIVVTYSLAPTMLKDVH